MRIFLFYLSECHSVLYARLQQSESGLYHLIEFGANIMGICVRFEFMPTCAWSGGRKAGGIGKWKKRQIIV